MFFEYPVSAISPSVWMREITYMTLMMLIMIYICAFSLRRRRCRFLSLANNFPSAYTRSTQGLNKHIRASAAHLKNSRRLHIKPIIAVFYTSFHLSSHVSNMHDKSYEDIIYNRRNESAYFTFICENHRGFIASIVYLGEYLWKMLNV